MAAVIHSNNISGTSYVLDVSPLNLLPQLDIRDFLVTHNGIDRSSSYTKTSATQLTYAGSAVVLGTLVQITRVTPLTFDEATFVSVTTANKLTNVMTKLKRRVDELEALVKYQTATIVSAGVSPGVLPIANSPFAVTWDNDITNAPSRNSVYDVLVTKADLASPTFTGTPVAPTPTPNTNSTQVATTAFVKSSTKVFARKTAPQNVAPVTPTTVTWDSELLDLDNSFNPTTGVYTVPANQGGVYLISIQMFTGVRTSTTPPSSVNAQGTVLVNGVVRERINSGQGYISFYQPAAVVPVQLNAGDTLAIQAIVEAVGGSGITLAVSPTNVSPELTSTLLIQKLT